MTLGEKLYGLRKKRGLSQEQLAECLNVSRQSISKWEGDITYPEADKLIALSEYFQVSLDYLMKVDLTDETQGRADEYRKPAMDMAAMEGMIDGEQPVRSQEQSGIEKQSVREEQSAEEKPVSCESRNPLLAGTVLCAVGVVGMILMGLMTVFLPGTSETVGTSSMITLNGTALLTLLFVGLLILGALSVIRIIRRDEK